MKTISDLRKPPGYVMASLVCSLGGFLFGIDTGIIGPVTVQDDFKEHIGMHPSPTIHGLIVSSILIPAAISSFFAGKLADALGRSHGIAIGSLIFAIGASLEAASIHIAMFIIGRVIEGIGEGIYLGTMVVYICEISPPRDRGALTTVPQLLCTLGLMTGFFTCYGAVNINSSFSWRLPFLLLATCSFIFSVIAFIWLPPSPRWLSLHGRTEEAHRAWEVLDVPAADREKIINQIDNSIPLTTTNPSNITTPTPIATTSHSVFSPSSSPRLLLAVFLMGMQQLSGIDGVLYYAPLLFQQAGLDSNKSTFLASGVSAIIIFAVTIPATIYADKWGRRTSTILGGIGMTITMFLMGTIYATGAGGQSKWVVIVSIYIFAVIYCISWAVSMKLYAAEIQPQRTRASATSIAHGSNWVCNFLVAMFTPGFLASSSYGAYFLFGGCTAITAAVCWVWMPETRGRNLDEIDGAFAEFAGVGRVRAVLKRLVGLVRGTGRGRGSGRVVIERVGVDGDC